MAIEYSEFKFDPSAEDAHKNEKLRQIVKLIDTHLSEPYSMYVYRFFLNSWPRLCYTAVDSAEPEKIIGCIISKVEPHKEVRMTGYIGMLAVDPAFRGQGIAKSLIDKTISLMETEYHVDEIILETEVENKKALKLYEGFGFVRTERLFRYYLNKHDAFTLVLPMTHRAFIRSAFLEKIV